MRWSPGVACLLLLLPMLPGAAACTVSPVPPSGDHFLYTMWVDGVPVGAVDSGIDVAQYRAPYCSSPGGPSTRGGEPQPDLINGRYLVVGRTYYDLLDRTVYEGRFGQNVFFTPSTVLWHTPSGWTYHDLVSHGVWDTGADDRYADLAWPTQDGRGIMVQDSFGRVSVQSLAQGWVVREAWPAHLGLPDATSTLESVSGHQILFGWNGTQVVYDAWTGRHTSWANPEGFVAAAFDDERILVTQAFSDANGTVRQQVHVDAHGAPLEDPTPLEVPPREDLRVTVSIGRPPAPLDWQVIPMDAVDPIPETNTNSRSPTPTGSATPGETPRIIPLFGGAAALAVALAVLIRRRL